MPTGDITYPGILYPVWAKASRTVGARPDVAIVHSHIQSTAPVQGGTLTIGFNGVGVTWHDCLVDQSHTTYSTHGHMQLWKIRDRRWRWLRHFVNGSYNVRLPDGTIDPATEKTLAQLATILFTAMGEPSANVSAITSTEKPYVKWEWDRAVDELEELLYTHGYVPTLALDDTAVVYRVNTGALLPNNSEVISPSMGVDPNELPQYLAAMAWYTRVQSKLKCEAVGVDSDGSIQPVDDLSYAPTGGWTNNITDEMKFIVDETDRQLAASTVGRWYRVTTQADGSQDISDGSVDYTGDVPVTDISQLLPLHKDLVETVTQFGYTVNRLAYVEATYYDYTGNPPLNEDKEMYQVETIPWKLDPEFGLVQFAYPLVKRDGDDITFADVFLTCSYSVTNNTTHVKDRYYKQRTLGGYGDDMIDVKELERTLVCEYDTDGITIDNIIDNQTTLDANLDVFLDAAQRRYNTEVGYVVKYRGIQPIEVDGITTQVQWNVAVPHDTTSPFNTIASQQMEVIAGVAKKAERRRQRDIAKAQRRLDRITRGAQRNIQK